MEKIAITGSSGFLGSRLLKAYNNNYDYEVMGFYTKNMDITDKKCVKDILKSYSPDYLIHCAAIASQGYAQEHPEEAYQINVEGTLYLAEQCAKRRIKLIYMSSDQVYNGCLRQGALTEEEVLSPENIYAKQKLQIEQRVREILPEAVGLRLTWLYDLPQRYLRTNSNLVWNIVKANLQGQTISFPQKEYRGITYVWELIDNMSKILRLPGGIYNCGSMNNHTTYETAVYTAKHMGMQQAENSILCDTKRYSEHTRNIAMDNSKIENEGIFFSSTEEGIHRCLKEYGIYIVS